MLTDTLAICSYDEAYSNVFRNKFHLFQPIDEGCKRPKTFSTYQFNQFNGIKRYYNSQTDNYHQILHR